MKSIPLKDIPAKTTTDLLSHIALFKELLRNEPELIEFFIQHSTLFKADPGEEVIRRGEFDQWIYFLLVGQLQVYPEFPEHKQNLVAFIASGETFGELAFIRKSDRNATILADTNSREILYLGTDFNKFGEVNDFSVATLNSKIIFYKTLVGIIRKRLQSFQIDHPNHELNSGIKSYAPYSGMPKTINELLYYFDQSQEMAKGLYKWNRAMETDCAFYPSKGKIPIELVQQINKLV